MSTTTSSTTSSGVRGGASGGRTGPPSPGPAVGPATRKGSVQEGAKGAKEGDSGPCLSFSDKPSVVLICVDASKQAEESFEFYLNNLHKKSNRVVLLHIIELPDMNHARQANLTPSALHDLWELEINKSKQLEAHYTNVIKRHQVEGLDATICVQNGLKPGQTIAQVAEDLEASMIVMGTRGMGLVRRTILGSASDYVIHHVTCPVIICHAKEGSRGGGRKGSEGRVHGGRSVWEEDYPPISVPFE